MTGRPEPSSRWAQCDPLAIPVVGTVLELSPGQWQADARRRAVRIRVDRVLLDRSLSYTGAWVWVEGEATFASRVEPTRQVLVRIDAIPPHHRDPDYRPRPVDAPRVTVDVASLGPGVVVRVGAGATDRYAHSIFVRITRIIETTPDRRITIDGERLTPTGRVAEHLSLTVPVDTIYPDTVA